MKEKLKVAEQHAEQLKDVSVDTWNNVKASLAFAMQDIEDAYNKAAAHLQ
jgi:hypothetical protein